MNKYLIFIFLIPMLGLGQSKTSVSKDELSKIYSQAISDFIKAANKKNGVRFDTLFFGKRKNEQADDFPNITLPKIIEKTQIRVISPELGAEKQAAIPSNIYINLMGWVEKDHAEFLFVVFSNGFKHQYDYILEYAYDQKIKKWNLSKLELKGPPFNK